MIKSHVGDRWSFTNDIYIQYSFYESYTTVYYIQIFILMTLTGRVSDFINSAYLSFAFLFACHSRWITDHGWLQPAYFHMHDKHDIYDMSTTRIGKYLQNRTPINSTSFFVFADVTCFQGFFHFSDMATILEHFCVYHVNAPGQDDGALPLIQGYVE